MKQKRPSLGWDLAGYGKSGSGLCLARRNNDHIATTILRAPFICKPKHELPDAINGTIQIEIEMLRRFAAIGDIHVDSPIDLQGLERVIDISENMPCEHYWQLIKRPVDFVFGGLEPLASNLGYAVARICHIVGQLCAEEHRLNLGVNLFETYPEASLQLCCEHHHWNAEKYKSGLVVYVNGTWQGRPVPNQKTAKDKKQQEKNDALARYANCLAFRAPEGCEMTDDEFDAAVCALTGCLPDCRFAGDNLRTLVQQRLHKCYGHEDWINEIQPPAGYVLFDRLPEQCPVHFELVDCQTPAELFQALEQ